MLISGVIRLLLESSLEEVESDGSLAGSSVLASPEAAELESLDCVAGHGELEEVGA